MDPMSERCIGRPFPHRRGIALLVEPEKVAMQRLPFAHQPTV